jgi:hypothetical protein
MATHNAISAVSQAILNLLRSAEPPSEFGSLDYEHYQSDDFADPIETGFSLYLWRVTVSQARRNLPPRRLPDGRVYRPSLPLDLHYLLTPWAANAETQQRMLGWAMRAIEDAAVFPAGALNYGLSETDTFAPSEAVEIICDPLALTDQFNLWDKLKTKLQTSMTYQARGILLDSQQTVPEYGLVQTRTFQARSAGS